MLSKACSAVKGLPAAWQSEGLGRTDAKILDMNAATERLNAVLMAVLWLALTGCSLTYQVTPATSTGHSDFVAASPAPPTPAVSHQEKPATLSPAASQPVQHVGETKAPSVMTTKGAEKLVAPSSPAPAHVIEKAATVPPPPVAEPLKAEQPARFAHPTVTELIVKGPPRPVRQRGFGAHGFLWFGLVLFVAAGGGGGWWYYVKRRGEQSQAPKSNYRRPSRLGEDEVKEPLDASEAAAFADES